MVGDIKFYNNREVVVLKDEGQGFFFVCANLNPEHDVTGSNWCTMCMAGGDFIASHTCEMAQEVIDNLIKNIEDHEVFWVHETYLKDHPFEYKPYVKLKEENERLSQSINNQKTDIDNNSKSISQQKEEIEKLSLELSDVRLKIQSAQHELMSTKQQEPHQELPKVLSTGKVDISTKELTLLLKSKLILDALESGGVDNWEWYSESCGGRDFESEAIDEISNLIKL